MILLFSAISFINIFNRLLMESYGMVWKIIVFAGVQIHSCLNLIAYFVLGSFEIRVMIPICPKFSAKCSFQFHLKSHHSKDVNPKFLYEVTLSIAVASYYVSWIMVIISRSITSISSKWNTFQLWNLSCVKRKIWSKIYQKFEKLKTGHVYSLSNQLHKVYPIPFSSTHIHSATNATQQNHLHGELKTL